MPKEAAELLGVLKLRLRAERPSKLPGSDRSSRGGFQTCGLFGILPLSEAEEPLWSGSYGKDAKCAGLSARFRGALRLQDLNEMQSC